MANKTTKMENLVALSNLAEVQANAALSAFVAHEIDLLKKKAEANSKADLEKQAFYSDLKAKVINEMEVGRQYRVSELMRELECLRSIPTMNTSTVTYVMTCLVREMKVKNEKVKGISLYSLV